jgi:hypothetical protein
MLLEVQKQMEIEMKLTIIDKKQASHNEKSPNSPCWDQQHRDREVEQQ